MSEERERGRWSAKFKEEKRGGEKERARCEEEEEEGTMSNRVNKCQGVE